MNNIYSYAIYGSVARNECDKYSDKDFLIASYVIDEKADDIAYNYERKGWNCSLYTYAELESLSSRGALFIQHIKQDGAILSDDSWQLARIVDGFIPKPSYREDMLSAKKFFKMLKYIELSQKGILWALDVISIALRNYSILAFADERSYEFSYKKLIHNSKYRFNLSNSEAELLFSLREYKYIYRNNIETSKCDSSILSNIIDILNRRYGFEIEVQLLCSDAFFDVQRNFINSNCFSGYQNLRLAESLFLCLQRNIAVDKHDLFYDIIMNPRKHRYTFDSEHFVSNLINVAFSKYPSLFSSNYGG